jgi:hypothetical protein
MNNLGEDFIVKIEGALHHTIAYSLLEQVSYNT